MSSADRSEKDHSRERQLIGRKPSYEFRSAGKLCTVCGLIVGNVRGDDQIHEQWHRAVAVLLTLAEPAE
ncbi:MAG: hypothetical protein ACRDTC_22605 [Pseudonocardiaceae bacterium]